MSTVTARVDSVELFERLADRMAAESERFERLGDVEMDLALVMRKGQGGEGFRVLLQFRGITCDAVVEIAEGQERSADCWLDGALEDWEAMFSDIGRHGHATGGWTLNSLTLFGDRIGLCATDPVGEDRFHRFNQTLQEFFDGAASGAAPGKE